MVETDSDTLAKEQFVSVYVYDSGSRSNWLKRLVHPRVLLFRYDPWNWDEPMPTIESDRPGHIRISIPRVSSVVLQKRRFKQIDVEYAIGSVEYRGVRPADSLLSFVMDEMQSHKNQKAGRSE